MIHFCACMTLSSILFGSLAMAFEPPGPAERLRAIGTTTGLPETLKRALEPGADFKPIPVPRDGDWLAMHREDGQTFDEYVRSRPNRPTGNRKKIYLQPLGQFPPEAVSLETLRQYSAAYFAMEVEILPPLSLTTATLTSRINPFTRKRQFLTTRILEKLESKLPDDAFCVLAVTMQDLYPDPSWNFVFGQASLRDRVGVYSFARYDPAFYGERKGPDYPKTLLRRSEKVLVHELAHMFGLQHCVYFHCVLNGSNHLGESDARPLHLCPICLRKLQYNIGFDVVSRYRNLLRFYQEAGFDEEARWVGKRLNWILSSRSDLETPPVK